MASVMPLKQKIRSRPRRYQRFQLIAQKLGNISSVPGFPLLKGWAAS
jgi:hypothetical protein